MKNMGNFIKRYGPSKLMFAVMLLPVILFLLVGVGLLFLLKNVAPENQQFLMIVAAGCIVAGLLFLFIGKRSMAKDIFELYENGIKVIRKNKQEEALLFTDIGEVYRFVSGKQLLVPNNLAFRKDDKDSWKVITPKISSSGQLIKAFLEKHLEQQAKEWTAQLESGKRLNFKYVSEADKWSKRIFATGTKDFLNIPVKTLSLDKYTLHMEDNTYALNETNTIQVNNWTDNITITDKSGKKIFSIQYLSLFNADLFIQLVNHLVQKG